MRHQVKTAAVHSNQRKTQSQLCSAASATTEIINAADGKRSTTWAALRSHEAHIDRVGFLFTIVFRLQN